MKSPIYGGVKGSKNSVAVGNPISVTSDKICLPSFMPLGILKVPFRSGSLIKPFQPIVVLGFSKYTRITI